MARLNLMELIDMREYLSQEIDKTNKILDNPTEAVERYTAILEEPARDEFLSKKEVANVFYNCSLARFEIAEKLYQAGKPREAFQEMWLAKSDIRNASLGYTSHKAIKACLDRITFYDKQREIYLSAAKATETAMAIMTMSKKRKATTECSSFLEHKYHVKKTRPLLAAVSIFPEEITILDKNDQHADLSLQFS